MTGLKIQTRSATKIVSTVPAFCKLRLIFATPIAGRFVSGALTDQRTRTSNVACGFAAFDPGEDRFEQRAGMALRPRFAPQGDQIQCRAKLQQARPVPLCGIDRLDKATFRGIGLALSERKQSAQTMQDRGPVIFA